MVNAYLIISLTWFIKVYIKWQIPKESTYI